MKSIKKTLKCVGTTILVMLTVYAMMWTYAFYVVSDRRLYSDDASLTCLKYTFGTTPKDSRPYIQYTNYINQVNVAWKKYGGK